MQKTALNVSGIIFLITGRRLVYGGMLKSFMSKNKLFLVFLFFTLIFSGCASSLQESGFLTPPPVRSKYFVTSNGGFLMDPSAPDLNFRYFLTLDVLKTFGKEAYLEVTFENPENKELPIIVTKKITPEQKTIEIESPKVHGLRSPEGYVSLVRIYDGEAKTVLLGEHRQVIQSVFDEKTLLKIKKDNESKKTNIRIPWQFSFDGRSWRLGHQQGSEDENVTEYVLPGETIQNWTELVTASKFALKSAAKVSLDDYVANIKKGLSADCTSLVWKIIKSSPNDTILEWSHQGCRGFPAKCNLSRVGKTENNIFILSYVVKTDQLPDDKRSQWLEILGNANL